MKKLAKLIFITITFLSIIFGLLFIDLGNNDILELEIVSDQAKEWKIKINQLCKEDNWSVIEYESIQTGIHTDNIMSNGELINNNEEEVLLKYLYSLSCSTILENAYKHFTQATYLNKNLELYNNANNFLMQFIERFGENSNLSDLSRILSEYKELELSLTFRSTAKYTKPLKEFQGLSVDELERKINKLKYYKSHFSKNTSIREKVNNFTINRRKAEELYYENLERLIENNYKSSGKIEELLDDQIRFNEISTNSSSIEKLKLFINNPNN